MALKSKLWMGTLPCNGSTHGLGETVNFLSSDRQQLPLTTAAIKTAICLGGSRYCFPRLRTGHFYLSQILASHTCCGPRTCHDNRYSISYRLSVNHSVVRAHNTHYQYWNEAIAGKSVFVARPGSWHGHLGASWHRGVAPTPLLRQLSLTHSCY